MAGVWAMNSDMKAALQTTLAFLALHLLAGAVIPLIGDEAYYTLWASGLDWDYYDHPPMIAWMIHAGGWLFGTTPLGVRLVPLLAMAGASLCVADMAADGTRARAVLYFNLSVLVLGVGGFATPDAPSTLFWLASTAAALRATGGQGNRWWLLAGLAAGLGIMSKFTNLFLGVGYVGWLLATRAGRANLRGPGPWLALLAAALMVLPLILWNLTHDGLGFERQFSRIAAGAYTARHLLEYAALLILLPGPLIGVLALRALPRARPLLLWSLAPLLAYFALHSLHAQVQANWLIPAAGALAVLAAQTARWQRAATLTTAALSFTLLLAAFNPWTALGTADTPPNQTRGWPDFLAELPPDGWIATTDYALTGQLYVGLPGRQVWSVTDLQRYGFRGAFPADLCNTPGWLVEKSSANKDQAATLFKTTGPEQRLTRTFAGITLKSYRIRPVQGVTNPQLCP
jgi:4-amino-4-deoxy-L-arabinose transferase-like glycosyltransferase